METIHLFILGGSELQHGHDGAAAPEQDGGSSAGVIGSNQHEPRVVKDLQDTYTKMTLPRAQLCKELKMMAVAA